MLKGLYQQRLFEKKPDKIKTGFFNHEITLKAPHNKALPGKQNISIG
jgi:hypothetical protein